MLKNWKINRSPLFRKQQSNKYSKLLKSYWRNLSLFENMLTSQDVLSFSITFLKDTSQWFPFFISFLLFLTLYLVCFFLFFFLFLFYCSFMETISNFEASNHFHNHNHRLELTIIQLLELLSSLARVTKQQEWCMEFHTDPNNFSLFLKSLHQTYYVGTTSYELFFGRLTFYLGARTSTKISKNR